MSITMIAPTEDVVQAERWRRWRLAYAESDHKAATRVRIVFTVVLIALALAFGVQLLSP
jgi:hypothetical protein